MQTFKLIILSIILHYLMGCNNNTNSQNTATVGQIENKNSSGHTHNEKINQNKSFVISCGSGCAMTYNVEQVEKINSNTYKVKFQVDNYMDEVLSDSYNETYTFLFDKTNNINKVILEGANQNALETMPIEAKQSFIEFSKHLLNPSENKNGSYFLFTESILPYQKKIDIKKIQYESMPTNSVNGLTEFACGEEKVRYIPIDEHENLKIVLIPLDCGDFPYRYYLITIYDKNVVSNLYVEGEAFEPDSKSISELTSFTIDKSSILTVKTRNKNFEKNVDDEKKYRISETGKIVEIE